VRAVRRSAAPPVICAILPAAAEPAGVPVIRLLSGSMCRLSLLRGTIRTRA
jgi:hypothetical protein